MKRLFSNRRIVVGAVIALVVVSAIIGLTTAYFQDVETSVGNKFVAGDFDLLIDSKCSYNGQPQAFCTWLEKDLDGELFFNFGDVKPSDSGEDTISFHIIDNDAWLCAEISNLINQDNGCRKPEQVIGDTTCGNPGIGEGELQDNIFFTVWKDTDCDNVLDPEIPEILGYCGPANTICDAEHPDEGSCIAVGSMWGCYWTPGQLGVPAEQILVQNKTAKAGIWAIADSTTGTPIPGDATICYGISWNVPLSTSNIIQSDSVVGNLTFNAVQARGMNDFKCSDLTTAGECSSAEDCSQYNLEPVCDSQSTCQGHRQDATCLNGTCGYVSIDDDSACGPSTLADECGPNPSVFCNGSVNQEAPQCPTEECATDADCDDGVYCNGAEICNPAGVCIPSGNPCPGADGDGDCSETCNETNNDCSANDPTDSSCNDGIFCNGNDTCSGGSCSLHAGDPCIIYLGDADDDCSESCNETSDDCTINDPNGSICWLPDISGYCHSGECQ